MLYLCALPEHATFIDSKGCKNMSQARYGRSKSKKGKLYSIFLALQVLVENYFALPKSSESHQCHHTDMQRLLYYGITV